MGKVELQRLQELQRELLQKIEAIRHTRNSTQVENTPGTNNPRSIEINELHRQEAILLDDLARVEMEMKSAVGTVFVRSSDGIV